ncbi:hypothetical protein Poly30_00380 [Planctomycetes bacterium Poly30]|uniref:Glycosyltransferase RgtA/B/C/D-like domain-containing protein n=1 Tax=Saltatorellus ferox TaxID=2528018 RepID=A0A518EKC5_9BACT|nr:hypothetical protein Poly30_00380 [Planctomycetes bacterium Poly30]
MRALALGLACLLLVLGIWPFLVYLDAVPLQPDSIKWIENAVPGSDGWSMWTFHSSHFVGYRPLTALSFTGDLQLFGASASALRYTDFALHFLSALALLILARKLSGPRDSHRSLAAIAGTVSLAWFVLHAGTDEVVPFLSRRSYPLASSLAFAGLLLAAHLAQRGPDAPRRGLSFVAPVFLGPLLLASMFGNELGALLAIALPFVVFAAAAANPLRRTAALTAWGWAWIAAGIWIRQRVLAGDSGYEVAAAEPGRALEIWKLYGTGLAGQLGQTTAAWCAGALVVGAYYLAVSVALAKDRTRSLPFGLLAVLAVYGAVVANEGVWFPRQVYPATALVALGLGLVAAWTIGGTTSVLRLPRWAHAIPPIAAFALMTLQSPLVIGTSPIRAERARVATSFASALSADLSEQKKPAEIYAVAPVPEPSEEADADRRISLRASEDRATARLNGLRVPFRWLRVVHPEVPWTLRDVLYVVDPNEAHAPTLEASGRALALPANVTCFGVPRKQIVEIPASQTTFPLPKRREPEHPGLLWIYGSRGFRPL